LSKTNYVHERKAVDACVLAVMMYEHGRDQLRDSFTSGMWLRDSIIDKTILFFTKISLMEEPDG